MGKSNRALMIRIIIRSPYNRIGNYLGTGAPGAMLQSYYLEIA